LPHLVDLSIQICLKKSFQIGTSKTDAITFVPTQTFFSSVDVDKITAESPIIIHLKQFSSLLAKKRHPDASSKAWPIQPHVAKLFLVYLGLVIMIREALIFYASFSYHRNQQW